MPAARAEAASGPTTTGLGSVSRKDGMKNELLLNFGAQGNVMNGTSYGFDYTYFNRSHPRGFAGQSLE